MSRESKTTNSELEMFEREQPVSKFGEQDKLEALDQFKKLLAPRKSHLIPSQIPVDNVDRSLEPHDPSSEFILFQPQQKQPPKPYKRGSLLPYKAKVHGKARFEAAAQLTKNYDNI
jgi:hypothetical protein